MSLKETQQEDTRRNHGHAASPRHFHHRPGPVYGLARTWRIVFPRAERTQ
jgi:hypothetical protein